MKKILLTLILLATTATTALSRGEYAEIARLKGMNRTVAGIRPMADGLHYTVIADDNILRYAYAKEGEGVAMLPGRFDKPITDYLFSPDETQILIASGATMIYRHSYTTRYYLSSGGRITEIMTEAEAPRDATFSPDGTRIAYSDRNDLYIYDIAEGRSRRLTTDGEWNEVINGTTDWVYEEELGATRAYSFSPDGTQLSYLRFDESEVPVMEMMRFDGDLYNKAYTFKYPKAGGKNSVIQLWTIDLATGAKSRVDTGAETDQYIPRMGYTPDGLLWYQRLNRRQNTFELVLCEANGAQRVIYREQSQQYIERIDDKSVTFIDGDRFLVRQESATGYMHLYLHSVRRGLMNAVTAGEWEVTDLVGTNGKRVWYVSTETSPLRRNLYSIALNGKGKTRLTKGEGYYTVAPSSTMRYFITTFSNATTPNRVELIDATGRTLRTLATSDELAAELARTGRPAKEFFTFRTERGDELNAFIIRPKDFDPAKKYPVLLTQYSGPGSQTVMDRWGLDWEDGIVENGYIVVCTDGRGTGFRGEKFKKQTYGRLGALEVEDQISLAKYMAAQPYIDPARIGIYGWSYGGFMSLSCALKGHGLFKMAISVAPVTSWRYYDTIYTEIYNGLPQYNAAGYDDYSPINFAQLLDDEKTRLLIMHGTADDNVHLQNTIEMTRALNRHGKQYDMMIYPDQNHSMRPADTSNVRQKMIDYTLQNL